MRLIKFRGKRLDNGEWVYGSYVECWQHTYEGDAHPVHQICDKDGDPFNIHPETVGQFTGLFDKCGKEAYEGDILGRYTDSGAIVALSIVLYDDNGFLARSLVLGTDFNLGIEQTLGRQFVVGNIHDNPELLKNE